MLCKLFRFKDPIAQGVAFGTATHVVGTSRAAELGQLQGAVSSLSLAVAGILTAILFPFVLLLV
jgi:putative effector of murein hydrolase